MAGKAVLSWRYAFLLMSLVVAQLVLPTSAEGVRRLLQSNGSTPDGAVSHKQLGLLKWLLTSVTNQNSRYLNLRPKTIAYSGFNMPYAERSFAQ